MGTFTIQLDSGAKVEVGDVPIGEGREKSVYKSCDGRLAVYFYRADLAPEAPDRRRRLEAVRRKLNPTVGNQFAEFWKAHYCWPEELITQCKSLPGALQSGGSLLNPPLGFVAPLYPDNFFFADKRSGEKREKKPNWFSSPRNRKNAVPEDEQGNFRNYLLCGAKLARAVRRLHQAGLAHSDLSFNNVLVDPRHGDALVIDVDALVVPDVAKPTVAGTQGYIAPEVLAMRSQTNGAKFEPGINTDRHALAVLLYEMLLGRHPLDGRKIHSEDANLNLHLRLGLNALFIEHPSDKTNSLKNTPAISISHLGPHLERLFLKTFVEGLHNPNRRATAQEWELALYKTLDLLHPSPSGKEWTILVPGRRLTCMFSGRPIGYSVPTVSIFDRDHKGGEAATDRKLILYDGAPLCRWHFQSGLWPDERLRRPVAAEARCSFHRPSGQWRIENHSGQPMSVVGSNVRVENGGAVPLRRGLKLSLGTESASILQFDFQNP